MTQSFRAFMEKIIDYAGLFPPAALSMENAVANYNRYRECSDSWMLSHFVCPAAKLGEFEDSSTGLMKEGKPFHISSLGRKTDVYDYFLDYIQEDVSATGQFIERNAGKVVVDVFEFCLPPGLSSHPERLEEDLDAAGKILIQYAASFGAVNVYYEVPLSRNWQEDIDLVVRAISRQNSSYKDKALTAGFKFRCGGVKEEQFPSVEQVVYCITSCRDKGVRLKLTAGLHHPFRQFNESVQTKMHGFINIFTAALLGKWHKLDAVTLTKIIEDVEVILFVVLKAGLKLDDNLRERIKEIIRKDATPRHVPAAMFQVSEIPLTISGKKVEKAVTQIFQGEKVLNTSALLNPQALKDFKKLAREII